MIVLRHMDQVQKLTDQYIKQVDQLLDEKTKAVD